MDWHKVKAYDGSDRLIYVNLKYIAAIVEKQLEDNGKAVFHLYTSGDDNGLCISYEDGLEIIDLLCVGGQDEY